MLASLQADLLLTCGLELQPQKSAAYIAEEFRDGDFEALRTAAGIPNSLLLDEDGEPIIAHGQPVRGITVCNIPVGSAGFIETYLARKQASISGDNDAIKALLDLDAGRSRKSLHASSPSSCCAIVSNSGAIIGSDTCRRR